LSTTELIRQWDLFSHFSPAQLEHLTPSISRVRFPAGTAVLRQGEPTHEAYVIAEGAVRIERGTPYGVFPLALLGTGDLFGETAFVDRLRRSGDAVTTVDSDLLALNPDGLSELMASDQRLAVALYWVFWKSLSNKLRLTNDKLTQFFTETGRPPAAEPSLAAESPLEFRLDLDAKRKLFEEQRLSSLEINFLSSLSREVKLRPGEVLFREGEPGDRMYVVLDGRIMISKYIPGAGEEALAFLERGDYFGEMALIDKQPRSAAAAAHSDGAVVLAIPADVLEGILDMHRLSSPRLLKILCSLVARRLRELDDKLAGWFILAGGHGGVPGAPPPA
jgi:CRP/FNR family transcriptional regulator, cyclic AMP receptor protein